MSILIFIVVLAILIFVHELGHFLVAKWSKIKVSEFGIGFPPALWKKTKGETTYSVNAIPFGGYVKILGEDPDDPALDGPDRKRSITAKPKYIQIAVLFAGVFFNILLAWVLISAGYVYGQPASESRSGVGIVKDARLVITAISVGSPAFKAGLKPGDVILEAIAEEKYALQEISPQAVSNFIEAHGREGITLGVLRGEEVLFADMTAEEGIIAGKIAIGVSMDKIGTVRLPIHLAVYEGGRDTVRFLGITAVGLGSFIAETLRGQGDLSQITGPVGIVNLVGDVSKLGIIYLMSFTAIISLNLAIINMFPFPALDGGRILFVLIEAVMRRPIPVRVARTLNSVGFALLLLLMIVVTAHDVLNLF